MTFAEVSDIVVHLSYGMVHLDLVPEIKHDGNDKAWKFVGI